MPGAGPETSAADLGIAYCCACTVVHSNRPTSVSAIGFCLRMVFKVLLIRCVLAVGDSERNACAFADIGNLNFKSKPRSSIGGLNRRVFPIVRTGLSVREARFANHLDLMGDTRECSARSSSARAVLRA